MKNNIPAFHWKRGNILKEQQSIFTGELRVESELIGIDAYKLCKVFNKLNHKKKKNGKQSRNYCKGLS
jgi:hypothetical protein